MHLQPAQVHTSSLSAQKFCKLPIIDITHTYSFASHHSKIAQMPKGLKSLSGLKMRRRKALSRDDDEESERPNEGKGKQSANHDAGGLSQSVPGRHKRPPVLSPGSSKNEIKTKSTRAGSTRATSDAGRQKVRSWFERAAVFMGPDAPMAYGEPELSTFDQTKVRRFPLVPGEEMRSPYIYRTSTSYGLNSQAVNESGFVDDFSPAGPPVYELDGYGTGTYPKYPLAPVEELRARGSHSPSLGGSDISEFDIGQPFSAKYDQLMSKSTHRRRSTLEVPYITHHQPMPNFDRKVTGSVVSRDKENTNNDTAKDAEVIAARAAAAREASIRWNRKGDDSSDWKPKHADKRPLPVKGQDQSTLVAITDRNQLAASDSPVVPQANMTISQLGVESTHDPSDLDADKLDDWASRLKQLQSHQDVDQEVNKGVNINSDGSKKRSLYRNFNSGLQEGDDDDSDRRSIKLTATDDLEDVGDWPPLYQDPNFWKLDRVPRTLEELINEDLERPEMRETESEEELLPPPPQWAILAADESESSAAFRTDVEPSPLLQSRASSELVPLARLTAYNGEAAVKEQRENEAVSSQSQNQKAWQPWVREVCNSVLVATGCLEPPLEPDFVRLRWQCVSMRLERSLLCTLLTSCQRCGDSLFGDVTEYQPGGIKTLKENMERSTGARVTTTAYRSSKANQNYSFRLPSWLKRIANILSARPSQSPGLSGGLPRHNTGSMAANSSSATQSVLHLLACIHRNQRRKCLVQDRLDAVTTDRELFHFMRNQIKRSRSAFRSLITMRDIQGMFFVKVRPSLVTISTLVC